jgi:aspartyl-tRNA(Asn)/glutamyl-tRNA(Gln) amidotransferase subunit C
MSVDTQTVLRIANLARIAMSEEEAEHLKPELNNILGWVDQLAEVNTDGVEPQSVVIANQTRLREDVDGFFAVPKVIE